MKILLMDDDSWVTDRVVEFLKNGAHQTRVLHYVEREDWQDFFDELADFRPNGMIVDYDMKPPGLEIYRRTLAWMAEHQVTGFRFVFYTKYADSELHRQTMLGEGIDASHIIAKSEVSSDVPILLKALRA